ncbi:MAG: hypothetical protein FWH57_02690 [Oscillospiraceae bacterium]|nr:hypothetical protein [Oscillospiraceae bacterium]
MPDIYFNSETGAATDINKALRCIIRTAQCLKKLDKYITDLYLESTVSGIRSFPIYRDVSGTTGYLQEIYGIANGNDKGELQYLTAKLLMSKVVDLDIESDWIIEGIGATSDLLHFVAVNNGMLLTFAMIDMWERDFICFVSHSERIPNIWGQERIDGITQWINDYRIGHAS